MPTAIENAVIAFMTTKWPLLQEQVQEQLSTKQIIWLQTDTIEPTLIAVQASTAHSMHRTLIHFGNRVYRHGMIAVIGQCYHPLDIGIPSYAIESLKQLTHCTNLQRATSLPQWVVNIP